LDAQSGRDDQRVRSISRGKNGKFPVLSDEGGELIETCGLKYDGDGQSRELYEAVGSDVRLAGCLQWAGQGSNLRPWD
jgi:hypothetical protein